MAVIGRYQRTQGMQPAQGPTETVTNLASPALERLSQIHYQVAKDAEDFIIRRMEERDDAEVLDAYNRLAERDREFMGQQYLRKGAEGTTVYDDSEKYFQNNVFEAEQRLGSQRKIDKFRAKYFPAMNRHLDSAFSFQMDQIKLYSDATKQNEATQAMSDAIHNRWNPKTVEDLRRQMSENIYSLNEHLGPEAARGKVKEAESMLYDKVIRAMAEDNPYKAKKYYDEIQSRGKEPAIMGDIAASLEETLNTTTMRQEAQRQADIIMEVGKTPAEQRAMAKKIENPDIRSETESLVNAYIAETAANAKAAQEQYMSDMIGKIRAAGSESEALKSISPVSDGKTYLELKGIAESIYKPKEIKTDEEIYYAYRRMIDLGQIKNYDQLLRARPDLSSDDWMALEAYFRKGGPLAQLTTDRVQNLYRSVTGVSPEKGPKEAKVYNEVFSAIKNRLPVERNATDDEIRDYIADALVNGEIPSWHSWIWSTEKSWYEAIQDGQADVWQPSLTDAEKEKANEWLRTHTTDDGKPFTISGTNQGQAWKIMNLGWKPSKEILNQMTLKPGKQK